MRVHLVHAHPSASSFSSAVRDQAVRSLEAGGAHVDLLDLYAEGFDPILEPREWAGHVGGEPDLAGVATEIERLRQADALVLVYPTWWFGPPAVLKGWLDRVWAPGVAFRLDARGGLRPGLANIRHFAVVTTYGSPWRTIALGLGDPGRTILMRGLAPLLSPRARKRFLALYDMDRAGAAKRARFLARVDRALRAFGG